MRSSKALKVLLGVITAVGNYLNGGSKRGQADGFDIEALGKMGQLKANQVGDEKVNHDLRHFVFETLVKKHEKDAEALLVEIDPFLSCVKRNLGKTKLGDTVVKLYPCLIEDIEVNVKELWEQCEETQQDLQTITLAGLDENDG